jgi:dTDP-glucose 4,6-dehydratase
MRLLVTGGCGFIASNFINYVLTHLDTLLPPEQRTGFHLVNMDILYYCAKETNVTAEFRQRPDLYRFIHGDICDKQTVTQVLEEYAITHVVHFAAQSHVQNSFDDSLQFTRDNVVGTHTLLECSRHYGRLERFIHVSTDEVYGESMHDVEDSKKTEHSVLCPTNPYAATKAAAELIAQSYYHSFRMPIIITRGNNVYGPNQYPEKLIPRFIALLQAGKKVTIQGDGSCVRAFMHVDDTSRAFWAILTRGTVGEIYNIGCDAGMEHSVLSVAHCLIQHMYPQDDPAQWIEYVADRPFNDQRYYISNDKLQALGWEIQRRDLLKELRELCGRVHHL